MEVLSLILAPVLLPMRALFVFFSGQTGSAGVSVLLLALTVALLLMPLRRWGRAYERRLAARAAVVRADVQKIDSSLRGEARFNAVESVYKRHGFHPAHNMLSGMSFIVQLPFLLAALLLFGDAALLGGRGFWLVQDLSQPDGLAAGVNVLPLLLLLLCVVEALREYADDVPSRNKYLLISVLLCALIYPLPAALVLYWMALTLVGALLARFGARFGKGNEEAGGAAAGGGSAGSENGESEKKR